MNLDWGRSNGPSGPTDPAFPQLCDVEDVGALQTMLRGVPLRPAASTHLRRPGHCRPGGEVVDVWHIAGRELHAVYRLDAPDRLVRVTFAREGADPPTGGQPLRAWRATAWTLPDDPGLPSLATLADPSRMARRVGTLPSAARPARTVDVGSPIDLLAYLPGRRATLRYATSAGSIVAKLDRFADNASSYATHVAIAARASDLPDLNVSTPLGVDAELGVRFETALGGVRPESLFASLDLVGLAQRVARAGAALHGLDLGAAGCTAHDPPRIVDRARRKVLTRVRIVTPELAEAAEHLVDRLSTSMPPARSATLHGDLHAANMLIGPDDSVSLVDLDSVGRGDPCWDLALFATRWVLIALVRGQRLDEAAEAADELRSTYEAASGLAIDSGDWRWYVAATLFARQVKACVRHAGPHTPAWSANLVGWASDVLDGRSLSDAVRTRAAAGSSAATW
jgi:aminoglycoside phosphotransferase